MRAASTIPAVPSLPEIADAITARLEQVDVEIAVLLRARSALTTAPLSRARGQTSPRRTTKEQSQAKSRRTREASTTISDERTNDAEKPAVSSSGEKGPPANAAKPARTRPARKPVQKNNEREAQPAGEPGSKSRSSTRRRRRAGDLASGQVEGLLRESIGGLSLVALVARTGVSEAKVRDRLHELERAGEVRNTGARRTSLWRWISDEERIADRVAQLTRTSDQSTAAIT